MIVSPESPVSVVASVIAVVFAPPGSEGVSVISMRPASRKERRML